MKSSNKRLTLGASLLLGAVAFGPRFCSEAADSGQVENATDATIVTSPRQPHISQENESAVEDNSIQKVQNAQSEEVMLCVQRNAGEQSLDVNCEASSTEMKLPGDENEMSIQRIVCTSYDREGHPSARAFTYIGPSCEPDGIEDDLCNRTEEIAFVSLTSEVPLGFYPDLNLPNLESAWAEHSLTSKNSYITASSDTQEGLSPEIEDLCHSTLELLGHEESAQNMQANDFSRELMNVSDFLTASGIKHELPEDSELFTPFSNIRLQFETEAGIPMSCAVDFGGEQLRCSPAYAGYLNGQNIYVRGSGWNEGLADPNCTFEAPLSHLWEYGQQVADVRDCSSGYIFTED